MALWKGSSQENMVFSISEQLKKFWVLLDVGYGKPPGDNGQNST